MGQPQQNPRFKFFCVWCQHTSTVEVINYAALALPPPKPFPSERCRIKCIDSCCWQKEKPPNKIDFNEIFLNQQETSANNDFIETGESSSKEILLSN